jgi:hypothetical protein
MGWLPICSAVEIQAGVEEEGRTFSAGHGGIGSDVSSGGRDWRHRRRRI